MVRRLSSPRDSRSPFVDVFAGLIAGGFVLSFTLSLAALIFSGQVLQYLSSGLGALLVSSALLGLVISLRTSFRPITAAAQDNTGVVLAIIAADIQQAAPGKDVFATLIAALAATTLITGLVFYLLGRFRLGKLVRFMPYPVVGGFLAGTGWLLIQGSLSVMSGEAVDVRHLGVLGSVDALRWVPGAVLGIALTIAMRRIKHHLTLPIILGSAFVVFFVAIAVTGLGIAGAGERGLLLGPFPAGGSWPPIRPGDLLDVDFSFLSRNVGNIFACVLLAVIGALLNASGYELATEQDVDQDRELRVHGVANLVTGLAGGAPGWLMLGGSMLSFRLGARRRLAGVIVACVCLLPLVLGTGVLGYFPKPVLGALLFFLGLSFIVENVYDSWFRLPRGEYALVLVILAVVVGVGFLEGVAFGIVVSSILFALNYARVGVVRHEITAALLRSKASRSLSDEATLREHGGKVRVFQLQGYVFFGTAHGLLQKVKEHEAAAFVVLDFRHVTGLDASAVVSFVRMGKVGRASGMVVVLTDLPAEVARQLERGGGLDGSTKVFPDLDRGLEHCERALLAAVAAPAPESQVRSALDRIVPDSALVSRLLGYFETVEIQAGTDVFRAGDPSDAMFLIESGEVEAWIDLGNGRSRRLRVMGPGTVLGEAGIYLGAPRSAAVRATVASVLLRLPVTALDRMTAEAPELSAAFHRFVAATLADRIVTTTSATQVVFH